MRARRDALRAGCRAFVATFGFSLARQSGAATAAKRVLLVHSFGRDFAPYDAVIAPFRREFASRAAEPVVFLEAALDAGARSVLRKSPRSPPTSRRGSRTRSRT